MPSSTGLPAHHRMRHRWRPALRWCRRAILEFRVGSFAKRGALQTVMGRQETSTQMGHQWESIQNCNVRGGGYMREILVFDPCRDPVSRPLIRFRVNGSGSFQYLCFSLLDVVACCLSSLAGLTCVIVSF